MGESLAANFTKKLNFDDSLSDSNDDNNQTDDTIRNNDILEVSVEEARAVWRWWEEEDDDVSWKELEHNGPAFPPPYIPFRVLYENKDVMLSARAEQMAAMYARTLDHEYKDEITKKRFNDNFFNDWEKVLNDDDKNIIKDVRKCDFTNMHAFYQNMSPESNKTLKAEEEQKYGYCYVTSKLGVVHKEKVRDFRIQAPDLCRSLGNNMGILRQVMPEDVTINCSPGKEPAPPPAHKWKQIVHNPTAFWLASWKDNSGEENIHYMKFHLNSTYNAKCDYKKYELAKQLHNNVAKIREQYKNDWKPEKTLVARQIATALYFIDELALRIDSVCSLRVKDVNLSYDETNHKYYVILGFKGKKGIDYSKKTTVDKLLYENLEKCQLNKSDKSLLFDSLSTQKLNKYLDRLMSGLTAKDFRTYHGSKMLEEKLDSITETVSLAGVQGEPLSQDKIQQYKQLYDNANIEVANLLNHVKDQTPYKNKGKKSPVKSQSGNATGKDKHYGPNKRTSKEFYNDPRVTAAWCIRNNIPVEEIFTKNQVEKFIWAIEMVKQKPGFRFIPKEQS